MNFDNLSTSKWTKKNADFEKKSGVYVATITEAKAGKSKAGKNMLTVKLKLEKGGFATEYFVESDSNFCQYKMRRFLTACKIPCTGEMSLEDLATLVADKQIVYVAQLREYEGKNMYEANMRDMEGYYPVEEFEEITGIYNRVHEIEVVPDGFEMPMPTGDADEEEF